jgi:hypothetical protein
MWLCHALGCWCAEERWMFSASVCGYAPPNTHCCKWHVLSTPTVLCGRASPTPTVSGLTAGCQVLSRAEGFVSVNYLGCSTLAYCAVRVWSVLLLVVSCG